MSTDTLTAIKSSRTFTLFDEALKRILDCVASGLGLIVFSPLFYGGKNEMRIIG